MEPSTDVYERALRSAAGCDSSAGLAAAAELGARSLGAEAVSLGVLHRDDDGRVTQTAVGFDDALASRYAVLSATDPLPGPAAMRSRTPLFLADRAATLDLFPATRPILDGSRYEAAACLPLTDDQDRPVGYLAAHYGAAHAFDASEIALLRGFAAVVSGAALRLERSRKDEDEVALLRDEVEGLGVALRTRGTIEQAKGMLMQRYDLSSDAAWQVLRRLSSFSNSKLRDVAAQLVAGEPVTGLTERFIGETAVAASAGDDEEPGTPA